MKVAVVRNRLHEGVICRFGQVCPEVYGKRSVQTTIDALRAGGHTVAVFEGDKTLPANLESFMPSDPQTRQPGGMVFNMAYGIQGQSRYTHVPAMLEMAGVPYTGAGPLGHAVSLDKVVTKILMQNAGVPTPNFRVMSRIEMDDASLKYPLIVKPRHESTSFGLQLVRNPRELQDAVLSVVTEYQQEALVEEYIDGREVAVALLGNQPIECLPLVEFDFADRSLRAVTWNDKYHKTADEAVKRCPAPVSEELAARLREVALATFRACHCKDYSRVDIRIDPSGNPFVLEINSMASLGSGGSYVLAATTAGYTFPSLVCRILDIAHERYFGIPAPCDDPAADAVHAQRQDPPSPFEAPEAERDIAAVDPAESASFVGQPECPAGQNMPYRVTRFYQEQIRRSAHYDRLQRLVEPTTEEIQDSGQWDTSDEQGNTVMPGLQHKYPQTVLVLATNKCFAHCRFCFRKRLHGADSREVAMDYLAMARYIHSHPEVNNALLSGGDPLALGTDQLQTLVDQLLPIPHLTTIRFGSRAMVFYPPRFRDRELIRLFEKIIRAGKRVVIVVHVDHSDEISDEMVGHVEALRNMGVQFLNQTVLLNGVNDDPQVLAATFERLHALGVYPYYLFQARPVKGAVHFQVPLRRGVEIVHDLNRRLSGIQKTFRYVMSHTTGKIEILDLGRDGRLHMRYHQNRDNSKIGRLFSLSCPDGACWLDDLSGE